MKLEKQVCTLQQAKRLKELGLMPKSNLANYFDSSVGMCLIFRLPDTDILEQDYPAYTVAELGVMMPYNTISVRQRFDIKRIVCVMMLEGSNDIDYKHDLQSGTTEAEARAAMLIYLLENNYITAQQCNEALG